MSETDRLTQGFHEGCGYRGPVEYWNGRPICAKCKSYKVVLLAPGEPAGDRPTLARVPRYSADATHAVCGEFVRAMDYDALAAQLDEVKQQLAHEDDARFAAQLEEANTAISDASNKMLLDAIRLSDLRAERDALAAQLEAERLKSVALQDSIDGCALRVQALAAERDEWRKRFTAVGDQGLELLAERNRLKQWVDDLHGGGWVNCVYCGHRYGPADTTPVSKADMLTAHIEQCPEHPMSKLKAEKVALNERIVELEGRIANALL